MTCRSRPSSTRRRAARDDLLPEREGREGPLGGPPGQGERLVFYQPVATDDGKAPRLRPVPALVSSGRAAGAKAGGGAVDKSGLKLIDSALPAGDYVLTLTAYDGVGAPSGRARLRLSASGGTGVATGVAYPDYGLPAVSWDDVQYVDLTVIIPPSEYGQFEATWSDYDFMEVAESDDFSTQDLAYLSEVALDAEELRFDQANWSDEFEDESLGESAPAEIESEGDEADDDTDDGEGDPDENEADEAEAEGDDEPDDADDDVEGRRTRPTTRRRRHRGRRRTPTTRPMTTRPTTTRTKWTTRRLSTRARTTPRRRRD